MDLENISYEIGLDLATALSVMGAALSIILQNRRVRKERKSEIRKQKLLDSLQGLETSIRELSIAKTEIPIRQRNEVVSTPEAMHPYRKLLCEMETLLCSSFNVWATDAERRSIEHLHEKSIQLHNEAMEKITANSTDYLDYYDKLLKEVKNTYEELANGLAYK